MEENKEYINLKILGRGNKGEITRKVKSMKDQKIYVLKDLGEKQLSETQKEILKILEQNECPYIVKHYPLTKNNFIKTDFINDVDLLDYLNTYIDLENPIEEKVLWKIFIQCIESVKYLHEKNIIHRNIRLENFYITDDKEIKLGNFRYATFKNDAEEDLNYPEDGMLYKSAETLDNNIYNITSDLYALGVVFYKLCYFEFPYEIIYKPDKEDENKGIFELKANPKKELDYSKELNELINSLLNIFDSNVDETKIYQMAINKSLENNCKNTCIESIFRCLSPFGFFSGKSVLEKLGFDKTKKNIFIMALTLYDCLKYFSKKEKEELKKKEKYINDIINIRNLLEKHCIGIKKDEEVDPKIVIDFIIEKYLEEVHDDKNKSKQVSDIHYKETEETMHGNISISQEKDYQYIFNFVYTNLDLCEKKDNKYDISKIFNRNLNGKLKLEYQFPRYIFLSIDSGKNYDFKSEIIYPEEFAITSYNNKKVDYIISGLILRKVKEGQEQYISFYQKKKKINKEEEKVYWVLSEDDTIKIVDNLKNLKEEIKDSKGIIEMIFYKREVKDKKAS